jgi:hypothetical protein
MRRSATGIAKLAGAQVAHRNLIPSFQALSVARSLSNQSNLATVARHQQEAAGATAQRCGGNRPI